MLRSSFIGTHIARVRATSDYSAHESGGLRHALSFADAERDFDVVWSDLQCDPRLLVE